MDDVALGGVLSGKGQALKGHIVVITLLGGVPEN